MDPYAREFTETEDGFIWTASKVLAKYLDEKYRDDNLKGTRILELGSGLGDLAIELQAKGAQVTCSDGPWGLANLIKRTRQTNIKVAQLLWGPDGLSDCEAISTNGLLDFDLIIGAELIGDDRFHDDLVWTLEHIVPAGVPFVHAFADRPFSGFFFAKLSDAGFAVDAVPEFDALGMDPERVAIDWISRRTQPRQPRHN
uniref:Methyltransferase domain-containing protein n=1 Tax=Spongospora subterranea TaxID=70186 RepID=A0A0H5RDY9_9EUKA|eukprot:CRZ11976.1 hypothetical protein [Spongospora subterranea]